MRYGIAFLIACALCFGQEVTWHQSECLDSDPQPDQVAAEAEGCALVVRHLKVQVNCCLTYQPEVSVEGSRIEVQEVDVGPPCDCLCVRDLLIRIKGLPAGTYSVAVKAFRRSEVLTFSVQIPPCRSPYELFGGEVWSQLGTMQVPLGVFARNEKPLEGFVFAVTFPLAYARLGRITVEGTATGQLNPEHTDFTINNEDAGSGTGWGVCSVLFDSDPGGVTLPAGDETEIVRLLFDLLPPSGSIPRSISVPIAGGFFDPPEGPYFVVEGKRVFPEVRPGQIQLRYPPRFLRGDANSSQQVNIADAVFTLSYLFAGGAQPACPDAADANDDGTVDIGDAVAVLRYLFQGEPLAPPSPEGPPGFDPTLDPLPPCRMPE